MTSAASHRLAWAPWLGLAFGLLGVLYGMLGFWVRGYDNWDRACIFAATAWLAHRYHPRFAVLPDTPRPRLGLLLVALGALAFLPPWYVYTQIGPRPILLWWEALALVAAVAGVLLIRSGPYLLLQARFLLIFPLFALPLPGRVQNPLHEIMQAIAADIGAFLLPIFGSPILERSGNRIVLPSGGIHIAEVCSGLYMIRTTLSITAFLAHWYKFPTARAAFLMAFSIPVIIGVNAIRVTSFGLLQEAGFPQLVKPGTSGHEAIGLAAYIPGLLVVLWLVKKLRPAATEPETVTGEPPMPSQRATILATLLLAIATVAGLLMLAAPGVARSTVEPPDFDRLPLELGPWKRLGDSDPPLDEEVQTKLTYNKCLHRYYTSGAGNQELANVWLLYWKSSMVVKDYHHPDICQVSAGDSIAVREVIPVTTPAGRTIAMTYREFETSRGRKYVIYWTQEGRRVWTEEDEAKAASFLFPLHWMNERFDGQRDPHATDDRLVVNLGVNTVGNTRGALVKLAGRIADELYTICPWADPKGP